MNDEQHIKYRVCAGQAIRAMRRFGHKGTDKELTAQLRRQAIGINKPSHLLNNIEFDLVLMVFAGWHSMADLNEQLRLQDQPFKRILFAATELLDKLEVDSDRREQYLKTIYERVQARRPRFGQTVHSLDCIPDDDFPLILGALTHTLDHRLNPRSVHRVGARTKSANQQSDPRSSQLDLSTHF